MDYQKFLDSKRIKASPSGFHVDPTSLNSRLFPFQRDLVALALKLGKFCLWEECGLGKTIQELTWTEQVAQRTGGNVLILTPLAVAQQTIREGQKFGIEAHYCRSQSQVQPGITVTNYEMLEHFDASQFVGIVLDESSCLKSYDSATTNQIIETFAQTPYKLACSATPSPNDLMELGNHAEFMGVMTREEMLAMFFTHDGGDTSKWRLKGHAQTKFWEWVSTWAVMIKRPSDLGYSDDGFELPELEMIPHSIKSNAKPQEGMLFALEAKTLNERRAVRKQSLEERVAKAAELVNADAEQWLVWCDLNDESKALHDAIPGSVEVKGSDTPEHKESAMLGFAEGKVSVLVSKPSICGFGLNFQSCHNIVFVGRSDSYEQFYQAVRRCWRFGQKHKVKVHVIHDELEGAVVRNLERKERQAEEMAQEMVKQMRARTMENLKQVERVETTYKTAIESGNGWELRLGDCVDQVSQLEDESVHYSVFSPPFASLYVYSNSDRDMGNSKDSEEFYNHFKFLVKELYRVLKPGRLLSFHCMNLPTSKQHHGYIGIQDFRGDLIRMFQGEGFIFHSEVCIWKDPVTAMQRTKAIGLLHKQLCKDSALSRQGIPDYLVTMRKPGANPEPIAGKLEYFVGEGTVGSDPKVQFEKAMQDWKTYQSLKTDEERWEWEDSGGITEKPTLKMFTDRADQRDSINIWQRYASPVWMDINPSRTLQKESARENNDERHICPLQLDVIERVLQLWTNPGDIVLSPFAGIGSEGHVAIEMDRRFIGIELKESYFNCAVNNLRKAELNKSSQLQLSFA